MSCTCTCFLLLGLLSCHHLVAARTPKSKPTHAKDTAHGAAWHSFKRLLDAQRGTHVTGLADLKRYFVSFGYMPEQGRDPTDAFDSHLEAAIKLYQSRLGLPVTGRLDTTTLDQIMSPRCGVGDRHAKLHSHAPSQNGSVARFAFFAGEPRWTRTNPLVLTYAIAPTAAVNYLPHAAVRHAFRRAFARWARVIPVRFVETKDYNMADVKAGFYMGNHGDGEPFDGQLGMLGHAFSPQSGQLHLDAAERWAVHFNKEKAAVAIDLESVATHEIGHILGLAHSTSPEAVMYPSLKPRTKKVDLTVDDVEGVQALYGSNPQFSLSSLSEPDTSAAVAKSPGRSRCVPRSIRLVGTVLVILVTLFV